METPNTLAVTEQVWKHQHRMDQPASEVLDYSQHHFSKCMLELWHHQSDSMNGECRPLPVLYRSLWTSSWLVIFRHQTCMRNIIIINLIISYLISCSSLLLSFPDEDTWIGVKTLESLPIKVSARENWNVYCQLYLDNLYARILTSNLRLSNRLHARQLIR